jgi:hypothetical protein
MDNIKFKENGASVDIVFCLDGTNSMKPIINKLKKFITTIDERIHDSMIHSGKAVKSLRLKLIVFRDFAADGDRAMEESEFFDILKAKRKTEFIELINDVEAFGGGDSPENGYEALNLAFKSKFIRKYTNNYHIVMLFTDAPALPLEYSEDYYTEEYEDVFEKNLDSIMMIWSLGVHADEEYGLERQSRRLILFCPQDEESWMPIINLERTLVKEITLGSGGEEITYEDITEMIKKSLTA